MSFIELGKSVISIVNGILIMIIFFRKPFVKWWQRNIASSRKKLIFKVDNARKSFRCIEKNLISEIEFDCPPEEMDDGTIELYVREYRFKIETLIYGTEFCNLFSVQKNIKLTVIHDEEEYAMFPLFIEQEGKDTRTLLISFKTVGKPPYGSIVKINLPQTNSAEG